MLDFFTLRTGKPVTIKNFWLPFFLFGILFNFILFLASTYLENWVFGRSFIWTCTAYCLLFSGLHWYIFGKGLIYFFKVAMVLFTVGLATVFFMLASLSIEVYAGTTAHFMFIIIIYVILMTLFFVRKFKVWPSVRFLVEIITLASLSIYATGQLDSIPSYDYGVPFTLSLWMLTTTYIVLVHHSTYIEGY